MTTRRAFTLTEILIVIGIIVLIIVMAVPALNLMTGSRSIDGAENQIAAALGRARADAIGVQAERGVLFYIDPDSGRVNMAEVRKVAPPAAAPPDPQVWLDLEPDRDFLVLPKGVSVQTIDNAQLNDNGTPNDPKDDTLRMDDAYLGFNTATGGTATKKAYGGVILFDAKGQIASRSYGFIGTKTTSAGTVASAINVLLTTKTGDSTAASQTDIIPPVTKASLVANRSQVGMVLFDAEVFAGNWNQGDPQIDAGIDSGGYTDSDTASVRTAEASEERWIDENSTPLLVNRYNGTLIRGE